MTSSTGRRRRAALLVAAALSLSSAVLAPAALAAPLAPAPVTDPTAAPAPTAEESAPVGETTSVPANPAGAATDESDSPVPASPTDATADESHSPAPAEEAAEAEADDAITSLDEASADYAPDLQMVQGPGGDGLPAPAQLNWGVKASFRHYIKNTAHGSWTLSDGASGEFSFRAAPGKAPQSEPFSGAQFQGRIDFTGHNGILDLTIADPEIVQTEAGWHLTALVSSKPIDSNTKPPLHRYQIAALDNPVVEHEGHNTEVRFVSVRLTEEGNKAFDNRYPANVELDPITVKLHKKTTPRVTDRLAGRNRYQTSHAVYASRNDWGQTLVLASGEQFADALAATALAGPLRSPVLLTSAKTLPGPTRESLTLAKQRGVTKVYAVGGTSAISDASLAEVHQAGFEVERLAGSNRFATARAVAEATRKELTARGKQVRSVVLVDGLNFADALAGGPVAAKNDGVLLLTSGAKLDPQTLAAAKTYSHNFIAIGGSAVTAAAEQRDDDTELTPLAGRNRYETALAVAVQHLQYPKTVVLTSGVSFPDALAGGALAAHTDGIVLLSPAGTLPEGVSRYLATRDIANVWLTGGAGTLSQAVFDGVRAVL